MNVAVIGVGSMGKHHARVYAHREDTNLVAVADPHTEEATKVARRCNTKYYADYQKMLAQENIDTVSIAVPTSLHKQVAMEVLQLGKNVLLEKPIASSLQEAQEIIDCAAKHTSTLMIGHILRFNPAIIELKKRLDRGELGEIYKIDVQRIGPFPQGVTDVGVIVDLTVHDLDIIHFLTQQMPKQIYATTQQKLHPKYEDSVTALVTYSDETLAVINTNYLSPTKTRLLKIFGRKGMFKVNYLTQELYFYENPGYTSSIWDSVAEGDMRKIKIVREEPLAEEIDAFLQSITNRTSPPVSGEQGLHVLTIAQLIAQSAKENKIIQL
jgi:UDP-N-acetylglucosamine 3-dehydrogenase